MLRKPLIRVKAGVVSRPISSKRNCQKRHSDSSPGHTPGFTGPRSVVSGSFRFPCDRHYGSNGKTLVKEMLASILCLERKTYRSPLSYNTQVGAALGLLGMRPEHEVAIIEAGISLPGEMERLERMIRPDDGILTVVSKAHIGGLGSLEKTLEEKGRLFSNLHEDSFLLLNADDPLSMRLSARTRSRVVTFGLSRKADITAEDLVSVRDQGHKFKMRLFGSAVNVMLPVPGLFNVLNSLAAAAAATLLGASPAAVRQGLENFRPSPMRLEFHTDVTGVTLINDTYNSDPASVKGALDVLAKVGKRSPQSRDPQRHAGSRAVQQRRALDGRKGRGASRGRSSYNRRRECRPYRKGRSPGRDESRTHCEYPKL